MSAPQLSMEEVARLAGTFFKTQTQLRLNLQPKGAVPQKTVWGEALYHLEGGHWAVLLPQHCPPPDALGYKSGSKPDGLSSLTPVRSAAPITFFSPSFSRSTHRSPWVMTSKIGQESWSMNSRA